YPVADRLEPPPDKSDEARDGWHDVAVRVQGPAAAVMCDFFRLLWEEQRKRPVETFNVGGDQVASHSKSTTKLSPREAVPIKDGAQPVQVLRTVPCMSFSKAGPTQLDSNVVFRWAMTTAADFKRPPLTFAPNGIFEFKAALQNAIAGAESYVFIADQGFS